MFYLNIKIFIYNIVSLIYSNILLYILSNILFLMKLCNILSSNIIGCSN